MGAPDLRAATIDAPNHELLGALKTYVFMPLTSTQSDLICRHSLFQLGKYSDLKITCGMKQYAVHKAIVCSRSSFFDGACSNRFREAESGMIDLSGDDPEAVDHMIYCELNPHVFVNIFVY